MQDPWILGSPVSGAEGEPASAPFRGIGHSRALPRAGRFVAPIEAKRYLHIGGCALAVAAGLPAILKKPLIFPCDGLDFLPNVICPLLVGMSAIGTKRTLSRLRRSRSEQA
jgi:hypothetical protein